MWEQGNDRILWEARDTQVHQCGSGCSSPFVLQGLPQPNRQSPYPGAGRELNPISRIAPATPGHQVNPSSLSFPICRVEQ